MQTHTIELPICTQTLMFNCGLAHMQVGPAIVGSCSQQEYRDRTRNRESGKEEVVVGGGINNAKDTLQILANIRENKWHIDGDEE